MSRIERRPACDRRAGGDRIGRQPPVAAAMRRDQDAEARRVDEMERDEPAGRRAARPRRRCGRDGRHCGSAAQHEAVLPSPARPRASIASLADHLAVAEAAVDDQQRRPGRRRSRHGGSGRTCPARTQSTYLSTRMTPWESWPVEVRLDQMMRDDPRLCVGRSRRRKDPRGNAAKPIGRDAAILVRERGLDLTRQGWLCPAAQPPAHGRSRILPPLARPGCRAASA